MHYYLVRQPLKKEAGANAFVLSPKKWIQSTNAIGITSRSGRYGGTYAHKDIAMEFASWISAEFKLYLIKDYQRLKEEEAKQLSSEWDIKRILSKINYKIHTDAIKNNLIPNNVTSKEKGYTYANEADILNVALFGKTAKQWRKENPDKKNCNMRDFATLEQLTVLSNLESINALMINNGVPQEKRLEELNKSAIQQMTSLLTSKSIEKLKS